MKLSDLLSIYGPPEEVFMSTYSTEYSDGVLPFIIYVFYPNKGILAVNGPDTVYFSGSNVKGCDLDGYSSKYGLWSVENRMTFEQAAHVFRLNIDEPGFLVLPIQEATNMDAEMFYETFKVPGTRSCIETPIELWPEQF